MRILLVDDKPIAAKGLQADIQRAEPQFNIAITTSTAQASEIVRETLADKDPFDVLLIDRYLDEADGIELMKQLRQMSPLSDAIIFTGVADQAEGQRAIEAGACDYFPKPLDDQRLLAQLRRLQRERDTRNSRNWLTTLAEVSKRLQGGATAKEVGRTIVEAAPELGFERARLWLYEQETDELIGLCQKGNDGLEEFEGLRYRLKDMPYSRDALIKGRVQVFKGNEYGKSKFEQYFAQIGFRPAIGERIKIPLRIGEYWIGSLTLDNAEDLQNYSEEQRKMLELFGNQIAVAVARASEREHVEFQINTQRLVNDVSLSVTAQAAKGLECLLDALLEQLCERLNIEVDDFEVVFFYACEASNGSCYPYSFYNCVKGKKQVRRWRGYSSDCRVAVEGEVEFYLIADEKKFGVILIPDRIVRVLDSLQRSQLEAIIAHQTNLIHTMYLQEIDKKQRQREELRGKLISRLQILARARDENAFWHAVLTFITHGQGYGFNRAILFRYLKEKGDGTLIVRGRMGIGYLDRNSWKADVEADDTSKETRSFIEYLEKSISQLHVTPLAEKTLEFEKALENDQNDPFYRVYVEKRVQTLSVEQIRNLHWISDFIPNTMRESAQCVLLPWKESDQLLGALLVDNAMDDKPILSDDVDALEYLLREASKILTNTDHELQRRRQVQNYERILSLSQRLTAQTVNTPKDLKEKLHTLCKEARDITGADYVVLYPMGPDGVSYATNMFVAEGVLLDEELLLKDKPRPQGVGAHVLRFGTLAIDDVMQSTLEFDGVLLHKQRYIDREQIAAFIGVPIRMATTTRPLGVLYFDFRTPKVFATSHKLQAEYLANVAGMVLGNAYRVEEESDRYTRESILLHAIQEISWVEKATKKSVMEITLRQARELFDYQTDVVLMQHSWETDEENQSIKEVYEFYRWNEDTNCEPFTPSENVRNIMLEAFMEQKIIPKDDAVVVPIKTNYRTVGCIYVLGHKVASASIERLANATAIAFDNVRRQNRLSSILEAVRPIVAQSDLSRTLQEVMKYARKASHSLACITLWYRDPVSRKHLLGQHWGLLPDSTDARNPGGSATQEQHELVDKVMKSDKPVWIDDIDASEEKDGLERELVESDFVRRQKIVSTAAFPLCIQNVPVGALFFSYRKIHKFSSGDRNSLNLFSEIVAASIYEEQLLQEAKDGKKRLEIALKIGNAIGAQLKLDSILQQVLLELTKHFEKSEAQPFVMLYNEEIDSLYFPKVPLMSIPIDNSDFLKDPYLPLDGSKKGIVCRVAVDSKNQDQVIAVNIQNTQDDPDYGNYYSKTRSLLCAGMTKNGRLFGVLAAISPDMNAFDEQDRLLFKLVAQQTLIALEREEQVAEKRISDRLTGVMAWASELAHDINVDIGFIRDHAYRIWARDPGVTEIGKRWAREIDERAGELKDTARDAGSERDMIPIYLDDFLEKKVNEWQVRACPNTKIDFEWGEQSIPVYIYPEQVWRAVRHLLRNAVEAMERKGQIWLRLRLIDSEYAELQIENSGIDIPPEVRQRIFREPFSDKGKGRGMGLQISRMLIKDMGGKLRLLPPQEGRGPVFSIQLVRAPAPQ